MAAAYLLVLRVLLLIFAAFVMNGRSQAQVQPGPAPGDQQPSQKDKKQNDQDKVQGPAVSEITAVPNRPTFSTTAESVERGVLEVEYGTEVAEGHQNINGLIKFGLCKNLELRFANNPFERDTGAAGVGDSSAGVKYRLLSQTGPVPTFSVLYTATVPTSTAASGIATVGHSLDLLASKDLGKNHFDFNEGLHLLGRRGAEGYDRSYFTAFDYAHPLPGKWSWAAELAGFSRSSAATPATMTLLLTAGYNVSNRLVLDAGEYTALYGNLPRITFFTGVTYSIADLYGHHSRRSQAGQRP